MPEAPKNDAQTTSIYLMCPTILFTLQNTLQILKTTSEHQKIFSEQPSVIINPIIFQGKYNNLNAYLVHIEPPLTPKLTISYPETAPLGQANQLLGVIYLALTGCLNYAFSTSGPWSVAVKMLSYLVNYVLSFAGSRFCLSSTLTLTEPPRNHDILTGKPHRIPVAGSC
ncbi:hypothetical protein DSO57_1024044 [Entomophthora muscae]|uniref:Uncharacterized protein n=1 Tax=Entomophthora muscae TaxID=34485 RepID=A0ACC2UPS5_9FUNG|nr:hypothetical protein DSO57_1024044 [Entomophthora muscae]